MSALMVGNATSTERLMAFSDGVFAVITTIMVMDLKPPVGSRIPTSYEKGSACEFCCD